MLFGLTHVIGQHTRKMNNFTKKTGQPHITAANWQPQSPPRADQADVNQSRSSMKAQPMMQLK